MIALRKSRLRDGLPACLITLVLAGSLARAEMPTTGGPDDIERLVDGIDTLLAGRWEEAGVSPANPATDAEFLRRVWLDIAGRIPPAADVQDFLADTSPAKRQRLVDQLLDGPNYVNNFTRLWRAVMLPEAESDFQVRFMVPAFEAWLRKRLLENVKYDELIRELLTTRIQGVNPYDLQNANPVAYYQAKETKPEHLAAATARMFLGIRLECAQCHDHPFDHWTRQDFWSFAAFFASLERAESRNGLFGRLRELFGRRALTIPGTSQAVSATYLDGASPDEAAIVNLRGALARWLTSRENPYFARMAANRVWAHFFGRGLVEPVDDFAENNPPSHPLLLNLLAAQLAVHDFDLTFLMRAIARSRAYQLSSRRNGADKEAVDPALYAYMPLKALTAEQLYDSLAQAIGLPNAFEPQVNGRQNSPRQRFLAAFADTGGSPIERQRSVLQALELMNGKLVGDATHVRRSITLAAVADYPLFDTRRRVETLFLSTLSRRPNTDELLRFVSYVDGGGVNQDSRQALGDVLWALLNCQEFSVNH